jgi:hypothetical protein
MSAMGSGVAGEYEPGEWLDLVRPGEVFLSALVEQCSTVRGPDASSRQKVRPHAGSAGLVHVTVHDALLPLVEVGGAQAITSCADRSTSCWS